MGTEGRKWKIPNVFFIICTLYHRQRPYFYDTSILCEAKEQFNDKEVKNMNAVYNTNEHVRRGSTSLIIKEMQKKAKIQNIQWEKECT